MFAGLSANAIDEVFLLLNDEYAAWPDTGYS